MSLIDLDQDIPRGDMALIRRIAADAGSSPEAVTREIVRAYLALVRQAPAALPADPLSRRAVSLSRKGAP